MYGFKDFTSESYYEFRVLIIRTAITVAAVGLRFLCKFSKTEHPLGWDDLWISAALALNIVGESLALWGLFRSHGGMDTVQLITIGDIEGIQIYLLSAWVGTILWFLSVSCICFSLICFYLRIFRYEQRFQLKARVLLGFSAVWGLYNVLGTVLSCLPPSNYWKMKDLDKCTNFNVYILVGAILEVLITAGILVLPIKPVLRLSLSLQTRISILAIFMLGTFVLITGILRAALVYQPGSRLPNYYRLRFWSGIHITAAFVSACLPMYRPAWVKVTTVSHAVVSYSQSLITRRLRSSRSRSTLNSDRQIERVSSEQPKDDTVPLARKDDGSGMVEEYEMWRGVSSK